MNAGEAPSERSFITEGNTLVKRLAGSCHLLLSSGGPAALQCHPPVPVRPSCSGAGSPFMRLTHVLLARAVQGCSCPRPLLRHLLGEHFNEYSF